jgi:KUP system potassium uptake protein
LAPAALACTVFGRHRHKLHTLNTAARAAAPAGPVPPEAVLGIVSLIFWSLTIVISINTRS